MVKTKNTKKDRRLFEIMKLFCSFAVHLYLEKTL